MVKPMFRGVFCALVTPFRDGALDEDAVQALAERQAAHGAAGLVVAGPAGEGFALSRVERRRVIALAAEAAGGKVPVIAAVLADSDAEAQALAADAKAAGANALLACAPRAHEPTQTGLAAYFGTLAHAADLPVLVDHDPRRTGVVLEVETAAALAARPGVAGLVDATADLSRTSALRRACPEDFALLTADDATTLAFLAHGGHGAVSLTCNVAPKSTVSPATWWDEGEWPRALAAQDRMIGLHRTLAAEGAAAVKFALSRMGGLCAPDTRAPLEPLAEGRRRAVMDSMEGAAEPMHPY